VKATDEKSEGFAYLKQTFSRIYGDKLKDGFLIGPQMTTIRRPMLSTELNSTERRA
jgi:hypothetical protein